MSAYLCNLFENISPKIVEKFYADAKTRCYKKGEVIYCSARFFIYVMSGFVKIFKESASGDEVILEIVGKQNFFGERFIFNESAEIHQVKALVDSEIMILPIFILKQLIFEERQLLINFLKTIFLKKENLEMDREHLSLQNAEQRLGCFFLRLCDQQKKENVVRLPYDKFLLATQLGMCPETFSRAIHKLQKCYDIKIEKNQVYLQDTPRVSSVVCKNCSKQFPCQSMPSNEC